MDVNSFHHQSTERIGEGLRPVAWSSDGVVEAIECEHDVAGALLLGVQWHAETLTEIPEHLALFQALVEAATTDRSVEELAA